jgi:hypothetical protein
MKWNKDRRFVATLLILLRLRMASKRHRQPQCHIPSGIIREIAVAAEVISVRGVENVAHTGVP